MDSGIAGAFSLQRVEGAAAAPVIGYMVDRYGPRPVLLVGAVLIALGFLAVSLLRGLLTFYLAFIVLAIGMSLGSLLPQTVAVNIWFNRYRSRAMALVSLGLGLGGIGPPLVVWLIETLGWREALRVLAAGMVLVGISTALVFRHRPEDYGYLPDGDPLPEGGHPASPQPKASRPRKRIYTIQALRSPLFWQLSIGISLYLMFVSALTVLAVPTFSSRGLSAQQAGLAVMGSLFISLVGRVMSGFLGDWLDRRHVVAAGMMMCFLGTLAFATPKDGLFPVVGLMAGYGLGLGLITPVRLVMVADYFGRDAYGELSGLMNTVSLVLGVASPVLVARWADVTGGDFRMPFLFLGFVCLVAIPIILTLRRPQQRLGEEQQVDTP